MAVTKAVREAKARLAELEAQRATLEQEIKAAEAKIAPLSNAVNRIEAKRGKVVILASLANEIRTTTLGAITPDTHYLDDKVGPKDVAAALLSGAIKLSSGGYGATYTARGMAPRIRFPSKANLAAIKAAERGVARAKAALVRAKDLEETTRRASFDAGDKMALDALVADLAPLAIAKIKVKRGGQPYGLRQQMLDLTRWDTSPIPQAKVHLEHALSDSTEPCPCRIDAEARQAAIRLRDLIVHIDGLPTLMLDCPLEGHGRHRVATEMATLRGALNASTREAWVAAATEKGLTRVLAWLDSNASRGYDITVPRGWCRKTPNAEPRPLVLLAEFEKQLGKLRRTKDGRVANEFICPGPECGETSPYLPNNDTVECESCGMVWDAGAVKVVKTVAKAA